MLLTLLTLYSRSVLYAFFKAPQPLLWSGSRVAGVKITKSVISNRQIMV